MIKKTLLILISLFILLSCSASITSSGEVLIKKYDIDISQDDAVISQQIEQNLKAYFAEKESYKVILTGTPKDYTQSANKSLYILILEAAAKLNTAMDIKVDLKNIDFQDGSVKANMFSSRGVSQYKDIVINFVFPENKIRTIENHSFWELNNTKEITLPDSVITIKERAFINSSSIEKLTLGNGLIEIGDFAFSGIDNLKEIIIPDSVKTIGVGAFFQSKIETLQLSSSLESIGENAFGGCNMKTFEIPVSVKSIGSMAFAFCLNLTQVTYHGKTPNDISYGKEVFRNCGKLTTLLLQMQAAEKPDDPAWYGFLGHKFLHVYY